MLDFLDKELDSAVSNKPALTWKPLALFVLYRLTLACLILILLWIERTPTPLGETDPQAFFWLSVSYLLFSSVMVLAWALRWPPFRIQLYGQVLIDIALITWMMHVSGGVNSGLGVLLVVAVAGGSILSGGRTAIVFAAVASLATLIEQGSAHLQGSPSQGSYTQAGLLGLAYFATAVLGRVLAKRSRESEALATQRGADLATMVQLSDYVIQRMQTGILVLDAADRVQLINESARGLLGLTPGEAKSTIDDLNPKLARLLRGWRRAPEDEPAAFQPTKNVPEVLPRFARLGGEKSGGTLIFLEDTSSINQQAQHLKLASLGRLTASIAHEIRNPLGAISHANQLLAESPHLDREDRRFIEIIREQSQRMNNIVENILSLSRRDRSQLSNFPLGPWLDEFIAEFSRSYNIEAGEIVQVPYGQEITVRMDPSQLHQVMWNLCQNGLRYSPPQAHPKLKLQPSVFLGTQTPYLDVIDSGPGVDPQVLDHIFEPFFTTQQEGTGLGLYLSRELCESNQAHLNYFAQPGGGSCFRITFADPRRRQVA